jgi:hypothetical protein
MELTNEDLLVISKGLSELSQQKPPKAPGASQRNLLNFPGFSCVHCISLLPSGNLT